MSKISIEEEIERTFDHLNRNSSEKTKVVYKDKPVVKEVVKEVKVETPCPPCPDVPECPENINVESLTIKGGGDIFIKPKNKKNNEKNNHSNDNWIFGDECEIHTPQEVIYGSFAITSLHNIQPSHLPPSFNDNPMYPENCNERNYQKDTQEQGKVVKNANNFNPKFLINDDNTAENGAIIVDKKGTVLGGNGRTMTLLMVKADFNDKFKNYVELLKKRSNYFGIEQDKVKNIKDPVLVRVINTDNKKHCEYYSRIFNDSLKLKMDNLNMAISYVKSIGTAKVRKIADEITMYLKQIDANRKVMSLRQIMNHKYVMGIFVELLENAKIINDTNRATFIDKEDGFLMPEAEIVIEYMFYAMVFDRRDLINYSINNNFMKIEQVFGLLLEIKTLEDKFNIINQFTAALEKMKAGKNAKGAKLNADAIYEQGNMFDKWKILYIEYLCMKLFEEPDNKKQKQILENYIRLVTNMTRGFFVNQNDKEITPEELLKMAFEDADVKHKLANLSDKKRKIKNKLSDKNKKSLSEKIKQWVKNDWNKPYNWKK